MCTHNTANHRHGHGQGVLIVGDTEKHFTLTMHCVWVQIWTWNKVALLQKVLKETPPESAPWILYMQPDTIIDDIAFTFPFEMYQGKDWVSVGDANSAKQGWASGEALFGIVRACCISTCCAEAASSLLALALP